MPGKGNENKYVDQDSNTQNDFIFSVLTYGKESSWIKIERITAAE